jgi:hypothetical protein
MKTFETQIFELKNHLSIGQKKKGNHKRKKIHFSLAASEKGQKNYKYFFDFQQIEFFESFFELFVYMV